MVRELISLPFRIAGKAAEGALGLLRRGEPGPQADSHPVTAPATPTSDWDDDAPVPPGGSDPDDNVLADKVSSAGLGRARAPTGDVNLNVENGVVFLRGHLEDPEQVGELVEAAGQVEGVVRVENLIEA